MFLLPSSDDLLFFLLCCVHEDTAQSIHGRVLSPVVFAFRLEQLLEPAGQLAGQAERVAVLSLITVASSLASSVALKGLLTVWNPRPDALK